MFLMYYLPLTILTKPLGGCYCYSLYTWKEAQAGKGTGRGPTAGK